MAQYPRPNQNVPAAEHRQWLERNWPADIIRLISVNDDDVVIIADILRDTGFRGFSIGSDADHARIQYVVASTAFGLLTATNSYAGIKARCLSIGGTYGDSAPPSSGAIIEGSVGIGTNSPTSALQVVGIPEHADNAAAVLAGLTVGAFYRTGDALKVVHS